MEERRHTCVAHPQYEAMILDLKDTAKTLVEGQMELKVTLIQLSENIKGLDRLEKRVDDLERKHREDDKLQEDKIDELRKFMYKVVGAISVISLTIPLAVKILIGVI